MNEIKNQNDKYDKGSPSGEFKKILALCIHIIFI
jgi:hypothetical protein